MKKRDPTPSRVSTDEILTAIDEQIVEFEGRKMSALEAKIRLVYQRSVGGDVACSVYLQQLRDRCQVEDRKPCGVLLVPPMLSIEEFTKLAYEQQAPFRNGTYEFENL